MKLINEARLSPPGNPPPPPPRPENPRPPTGPGGPTGPGRLLRRVSQVRDLRTSDWFTSPVDRDPVYVESIDKAPDGCRYNAHINGACYPLTSPITFQQPPKRKVKS